MQITSSNLYKIGSTAIPAPSACTVSILPLHGEDSGRTADGIMHTILISYVEGKGYMTVTQANNTYIISTRLYAGIEAYINTAMGEAKIISACSGTYQTAEGMSSYPTTTVMNSSITQSVNNKFATLALSTTSTTGNNQTSSTISIKSGTATLGSSVTISAAKLSETNAAQSASAAASQSAAAKLSADAAQTAEIGAGNAAAAAVAAHNVSPTAHSDILAGISLNIAADGTMQIIYIE